MANKPWLSILIPVYNVEQYLGDCVDSVMEQLSEGVEVLLLNDASTDGSPALMQALAQRYPGRLQLLQHPRNAGLSAARNTLMEASQGEYLWFLDSDDLLMPGAIVGLQRYVEQFKPDLLLCDFRTVRERMRLKHKWRGELHRHTFDGTADQLSQDRSALLAGLFGLGHLHAWSKISRRQLWADDLRFPAGRYFEDMATTPELALRAQSFVYAPHVWVGYRQRANSILASMSVQKVEDMMLALQGFPQRLQALLPSPSPEAIFAAGYFAARSFICACRVAEREAQTDRLAAYLQQFRESSVLSPEALLQQFLRRGWFWRAGRLGYWIHRAKA
ncbi:glycosyltransferase family 2 protein [Roseateles sp.]|uniref:glycosyltransferase family 2 protein n=1 Tax=Roseateles sp. TaxID=1971397 RepID=UPI003BA516EF